MHESERDAATSLMMPGMKITDSYVIGEVDDSQIPYLQQKGLMIQSIDDKDVVSPGKRPSAVETPGRVSEPAPGVWRSTVRDDLSPVEVSTFNVDAQIDSIDENKPNYYLIGIRGPILESWRNSLTDLGVKLLEYVPRNNYTAKLTPQQARSIKELTFVKFVRVYDSKDTGPVNTRRAPRPLPPKLARNAERRARFRPPPRLAGSVEMKAIQYDIRLHTQDDSSKVMEWLQKKKIIVAGTGKRKIRIYLPENSETLLKLRELPEVASIEEYVPPKFTNDLSRIAIGIDTKDSPVNPNQNIRQTGDGQIVGVADSGLDISHPDFAGRIRNVVALGRPGDLSDPEGHGTHVAGSIVGTGTASGGEIRGIAPDALLVFQSLLDAEGNLYLPVDLGELFEDAYAEGARIHNNSWGANTKSMYTANSTEVDAFIEEHQDMLIVIAAGNDGTAATAADRRHSNKGFVDWLSIGSPASSKNALTVGACRSSRASGGYSTMTYGSAADFFGRFPDPPIAIEKISGNPECMAAFSSRGPVDDRRIKPDIVAPGTDIASIKSSIAAQRKFWGAYPGYNNHYAFLGGTSMATPLVTGCAALVREYYIKVKNHHSPSAALVKATLINGARWLTGPDAVADNVYPPNYHQGFGCIYMPYTIPNDSEPDLKLEFIDTWRTNQQNATRFYETGNKIRVAITDAGSPWLRICLCWTDPPGRAVQNQLNVFVEHIPTKKKWTGNQNRKKDINTMYDPDNNVQIVHLQNSEPGQYIIQVQATNLARPPQDYALVVTGNLLSPLTYYSAS
jgi:serine protease AprX